MRSSEGKLFVYEKNQLIEVICQLRFPPILVIDTKEPADFQETVRETFPRYLCQTETPPAAPGQTPQTVQNHNFISADGASKLALTKNFIALSTTRYTGWEDFAGMLDEPLGQFIRLYKPAYFSRIGLRYLNAFSREQLGLTGRRWNDLLQPQVLGILDDDSINESDVVKCSFDVERRFTERFGLRLHTGPGNIRRMTRTDAGLKTVQESETRFILDIDVYTIGNTALGVAAEAMEQLHVYADRVFSDAITDALHDAMEPVTI